MRKRFFSLFLRGREVQDQTGQQTQETVQQPEQGAPVTVQNAPAPQADATTTEINTAEDWKTFVEKVNSVDGLHNATLMTTITIPSDCPAMTRAYQGEFNGNGNTISAVSGKNIFPTVGSQGVVQRLVVDGGANLCKTNEGTIRNCAIIGGGVVVEAAKSMQPTNGVTIVDGVSRSYFKSSTEGAIYTLDYERIKFNNITPFLSGEACWLLNGETTEAASWFQKLSGEDKDPRPRLIESRGTVYCGYSADADCTTKKSYSNTAFPENVTISHKALQQTNGQWKCSGCQTPFTLTASIDLASGDMEWSYGTTPSTPATFTVTETHSFNVPNVTPTYQWYCDN